MNISYYIPESVRRCVADVYIAVIGKVTFVIGLELHCLVSPVATGAFFPLTLGSQVSTMARRTPMQDPYAYHMHVGR